MTGEEKEPSKQKHKQTKTEANQKQENPPFLEEVGTKVSTHRIPRNFQSPALWFYILLEILQ